jgi:hypothetical protein
MSVRWSMSGHDKEFPAKYGAFLCHRQAGLQAGLRLECCIPVRTVNSAETHGSLIGRDEHFFIVGFVLCVKLLHPSRSDVLFPHGNRRQYLSTLQ